MELAGCTRYQTDQGLGQTRFATARFADNAQGLAFVQVKADALDGFELAGFGPKPGAVIDLVANAQVTHLQQDLFVRGAHSGVHALAPAW
jgi:hypothetical protein